MRLGFPQMLGAKNHSEMDLVATTMEIIVTAWNRGKVKGTSKHQWDVMLGSSLPGRKDSAEGPSLLHGSAASSVKGDNDPFLEVLL